MMIKRRPNAPPHPPPSLTLARILSWVDDHYKRSGKHPNAYAGLVMAPDAPLAMNWRKIDNALRLGSFGMPGGHTLAGILYKYRGVRNKSNLPRLTDELVLSWADDHRARTGSWPTEDSGTVIESPGETWSGINMALSEGLRGLRGDRSLAKLIARRRRVRNKAAVPKLTIEKILRMADAFHKARGRWPKVTDRHVPGRRGESWSAINDALHQGKRGLVGGDSLAEVLRVHRGRRNKSNLPRLTEDTILRWAKEHMSRTGGWPTRESGPILDAQGETWKGVTMALVQGLRGLPGGSSLAKLLVSIGDR
jgi:hypothetical protein